MKYRYHILLLKESVEQNSEIEQRLDELTNALSEKDIEIRTTTSYEDLNDILLVHKHWDCVLLTWSKDRDQKIIQDTIHLIHERQPNLPCFLITYHNHQLYKLEQQTFSNLYEVVWILQENILFLYERVMKAIKEYNSQLLPPLMKAVFAYNKKAEYSWAVPGHQGGVGFTKTALGRRFFDFYDENMFLTDIGIERASVGSLLDHIGPFHQSEVKVAEIFGADHSFSVLVGTSGSNRTILQSILTDDDVVLIDRNCHKSIEQGLINSGATPVYMIPTRNHYGIIGPIPPSEMTPEAVQKKMDESPLVSNDKNLSNVQYAVVTNCTYDGLCYNASKAEDLLDKFVPNIHFDEAWYGYARFHPMYADHFAMRGDRKNYKGKANLFATHSTHKLLNCLSQGSYIHVRDGENPIRHETFLQAYAMHATTSPYYPLAVSNEVGAVMMEEAGESLVEEVIREAILFRQTMSKFYEEFKAKGEWFFKVWNAPIVKDSNGKEYKFHEAPIELLMKDQSFWSLKPKDTWHGFSNLPENWVLIDPVKVSLLSPGVAENGTLEGFGVPAQLVAQYFTKIGIVPTRTTDFQNMFLFAMGVTEGKSAVLVDAFVNFKQLYDANEPLAKVLPDLVEEFPEVYSGLGLRDLGEKIMDYLRKYNPEQHLNSAYSNLPQQKLTPQKAYKHIVKNNVELVPITDVKNRIIANSLIPYPPGIPMIMSGEFIEGSDSPQIAYLQSLEEWDRLFPGFEHEVEGLSIVDGKYHLLCIK